ncbi:MAG: glycosyltransferase [Desulfobacteraceae bacterium]|nr:glycosyltransferase [Desulfobacteraceae bacterium]
MLDIIIVNYNSTDYLVNCLRSVEKTLNGKPARIFVQDNASKDRVGRILSEFPRIKLTINRHNIGFAKAVNKALKQGTNDYAVLLNPDTYLTDGFIESCILFMKNNPDVGILGPRILDNDGRLQNSARAFPTLLTAFFGRSSFLSRTFPKNPITFKNLLSLKSDGKSPMEVDWVSGACMVIRRKAIEEIGLLDERFFMYWEDADWCRRMWEAGRKVVYFPQASVYHYGGRSSEKIIFRSVIEFHKSVYRLFDKHLYPSLAFMKPLVLGGLTIRLFFVLFSHLMKPETGNHSDLRGFQNPVGIEPTNENRQQISNFKFQISQKIKILRIISRLNIGGPAIHVHLLTNGLNMEKFDSKLITGKISPQEGDMSYLFDCYKNKPVIVQELQREISFIADLKAFIQIFMILFREKPDIVHTHTAKAGFSSRFAVMIHNIISSRNVLIVHTFHGHVFEGYFNKFKSRVFLNIERFLARVTDAVIAISDTQKQELAGKYQIAEAGKIRNIELGFDLHPFFSSNSRKGQLRQRLGIGSDTLLIGIIGRLVPIKNHKMFFNSAKLFLEQNPGIQVKFIIVGDGELREELKAYCREKDMADHVIFCGWIKNVPFVYADIDIIALTSLNEGTPVSIIESMAASVPVIATDAGGVKDLLGNKEKGVKNNPGFQICERGILCQKNDAQGFASGLKYLAADTGGKSGRIKRARFFVENRFDHKRLLHDIESLYLRLMNIQ